MGGGGVAKQLYLQPHLLSISASTKKMGSHSYDNAEPATTGKWHINQFVLAEWQKYTAISLSASG